MMMFSRRLAQALTALALSRVVGAQELRGTVREVGTKGAVSGAVLLLLDSVGVTRARNITDEHGAYRIAAAAWMRRMRVVRIGFRPREIDLPPIGTGVITVDVEMTTIPVLLEPVRVKTGARCSRRPDRLAALSLLEQARAGLLATVVAREARPAEIVRIHFSSRLRGPRDSIISMSVQADSTDTSHVSFVAPRSAADFVQSGFALQNGTSATFEGPDAETLLDDDFRDGYCFQLRDAEASRANQVGLGFVAADMRRGRIDIDGTLWVDTVARRLVDIQYMYTGLPRALEAIHPGGEIHFRELPNGVVIVDRWSLRLPEVPMDSARPARSRAPSPTTVFAQATGGVIASAHWPGGLQWDASLGLVRASVINPSGRPAVGQELTLANTTYRGITDSAGVAIIGQLLPGPYAAVVREAQLDPIQIAIRTTTFVHITGNDTIDVQVRAPSVEEYVKSRCETGSIKTGQPVDYLIIGRVFDQSDKPVSSAVWSLVREAQDFKDSFHGTTGSDGIFQFCGSSYHDGDPVTIEARRSANDPPFVARFNLRDRLSVVRMSLTPPAR
jgi:hypothetical protein